MTTRQRCTVFRRSSRFAHAPDRHSRPELGVSATIVYTADAGAMWSIMECRSVFKNVRYAGVLCGSRQGNRSPCRWCSVRKSRDLLARGGRAATTVGATSTKNDLLGSLPTATPSWSLLESAAPDCFSLCWTRDFQLLTANPQLTLGPSCSVRLLCRSSQCGTRGFLRLTAIQQHTLEYAVPGPSLQYGTRDFPGLTANPQHTTV